MKGYQLLGCVYFNSYHKEILFSMLGAPPYVPRRFTNLNWKFTIHFLQTSSAQAFYGINNNVCRVSDKPLMYTIQSLLFAESTNIVISEFSYQLNDEIKKKNPRSTLCKRIASLVIGRTVWNGMEATEINSSPPEQTLEKLSTNLHVWESSE